MSDLSDSFIAKLPHSRSAAVHTAYAKAPDYIVSAINQHCDKLRCIKDTEYETDCYGHYVLNRYGMRVKESCHYSPMEHHIAMHNDMTDAEYGDQTDKDRTIYYRILKTTFYDGDPAEITGLHTEALGVLFPVDSMDSCEEMMIKDWHGALYKKDDKAFLCWTYSPEITYVLEYEPSKIDDSEIIKMAESAEVEK